MPKNPAKPILEQIDSLPPMPSTVSKVLSVTADPDSCGDDLVNAILPDPAMCAAILKIANSAFFGIPREVATLDKAVNVLGFNEVHNIVLGKAVFNTFKQIPQANKHVSDAFWQHSFCCGLAAKIIADDLHLSASEFFIAGLIHDIGKLIFLLCDSDKYVSLLTNCNRIHGQCIELEEMKQFATDHCQVGSRLLTRWMFPPQLIAAVGKHHTPEEDASYEINSLIIQISDIICLLLTEEVQPKIFHKQFSTLLPNGYRLAKKYNFSLDEELIHEWKEKIFASIEQDGAIMHIFTS